MKNEIVANPIAYKMGDKVKAVATAICGCSKTPTVTTSADNIGGGPSHYSGSTDITWTANCPGGGTATETGTAEYDFWVYTITNFAVKPLRILNATSIDENNFVIAIEPQSMSPNCYIQLPNPPIKQPNARYEGANAEATLLINGKDSNKRAKYEVFYDDWITQAKFTRKKSDKPETIKVMHYKYDFIILNWFFKEELDATLITSYEYEKIKEFQSTGPENKIVETIKINKNANSSLNFSADLNSMTFEFPYSSGKIVFNYSSGNAVRNSEECIQTITCIGTDTFKKKIGCYKESHKKSITINSQTESQTIVQTPILTDAFEQYKSTQISQGDK